MTPDAAAQGALELRATDVMGGAAPDGVTVSGTVSRGGKALAGAPLAFAAAGGGTFRAGPAHTRHRMLCGVWRFSRPKVLRSFLQDAAHIIAPTIAA